jgi:nucleolar protein TMA23
MNASALLTSQGWRGKGHSLHKTDDSIGLAKPLLLNRKDNTKGLGTTQHFTSDQWWMNAFDEQLKGLETSKDGKVKQTIKTGKLNAIEKGSLGKYSLYLSFVRGGFLEGTLHTSNSSSDVEDSDHETPATSDPEEKADRDDSKLKKEEKKRLKEKKAAKRKEKEEKRAKKETKKREEERAALTGAKEEEERRARKAEKRRLQDEKAKKKADRRRTKEERRARKEEKRRRREQPKAEVTC